MKNFISTVVTCLCFCFVTNLSAQQMGVNTTSPHSSAILDVNSSNKGLRVPIVTDGNLPSDATEGLMLYNSTEGRFNFFENDGWVTSTPWNRNGSNPYVFTPKVGIGITDPTFKLHLSTSSSSIFKLASTSGNPAIINYESNGNTMTMGMAPNGDLEVNGEPGGIVPCGGIIMWSGSTVPAGWVLCNGASGTGTPNLVDRFIQGGQIGDIGDTGGSASSAHTHSVNPPNTSTTSDGAHTHTVNPDGFDPYFYTGSNNTNKAGDISFNLIGSLTHIWVDVPTTTSNEEPNHSHNVNIGSFTSGGASNTENRPPYYVLAFIMKKCN